MGLDITTYRNLKLVDPATIEMEDGYPKEWDRYFQARANPHFPVEMKA